MDRDAVDAELRSLGKDEAAIGDVMDRHRPSEPLHLADVDAELAALAKGVNVPASEPSRKASVRPAAAPVQNEEPVLDVSTKEVMIDMNFEDEVSDSVRVSSVPPPASREDILDLLNQVSVVDDRGMDPVSVVEIRKEPASEEFPEVIAEAVLLDEEEFETIERESIHPAVGALDDADDVDVGTAPRAGASKAATSMSPELSVSAEDDDEIPSLEDRIASLETPESEADFEMLVEDEFVSFDQTGVDELHAAAAENPATQPDVPVPSGAPPGPSAPEARPSERKGLFKKIFGD